MKFLSIYRSVERGVPPSAEEMAAMGKLIDKYMRSGALLATEGCLPSALGARVRLSNGKVSVTDGPFTETKEVVGGFAILQAKSKQERSSRRRNSCKSQATESARFGRSSKPALARTQSRPNERRTRRSRCDKQEVTKHSVF